jgi:hypothetical protein
MDRRDRALAVALFAISAATSTLLNDGVVCCNDGSHYALVRSLADRHTVIIDEFAAYTDYNDISRKDDHYYSDRPPGTAFAALPFYLTARALGLDDHGKQRASALVSLLAGAFAVMITFMLGRRLGLGRGGAFAAALALALCTLHRTYSSSLWNHALSAFLVVLGAWLAEANAGRWKRLALGLVCGYMVVVDYSSAVVAAILCGCVAWDRRKSLPSLAPLVLGLLVGVAPALIYHQIAFGSPFATPYRFHAEHHAVTRSVGSLYAGPFFDGFLGLLFSWRAGLLLYSPIIVLGLLALPRWVKQIGRREAVVTVLPFIAMLLVTSKHATWHGGGAHDARYLSMVVPLLCLPIGAAFDHAFSLHDGRPRVFAIWLYCGVFLLSVTIQFFKHPFGWMQNAAQWFPAFTRVLDGGDAGPTAARLLHLLFPHPLAALGVLVLGGGAALWLARSEASAPSHAPQAVLSSAPDGQ